MDLLFSLIGLGYAAAIMVGLIVWAVHPNDKAPEIRFHELPPELRQSRAG